MGCLGPFQSAGLEGVGIGEKGPPVLVALVQVGGEQGVVASTGHERGLSLPHDVTGHVGRR